MCNVYAMYSFEPTKTSTGKQKTGSVPIHSCWDNEFSSLTKYAYTSVSLLIFENFYHSHLNKGPIP